MKTMHPGHLKFILLFFLAACTSIFYQGDRNLYATPDQEGLDYREVKIIAEDGNVSYGWLIHKKERRGKGLIFQNHGNAQNMSAHFLSLSWLVNKGYDLLVWDYRGYGKSAGSSRPKGVYLDAKAALAKAHELAQEYPRFVVYGQSLGGAITMRVVEEDRLKDKIDLVVLDSTFYSYRQIASDRLRSSYLTYLLSPLGYILVSDKFAPQHFAETFRGKVLVVHGTTDAIVPFSFGEDIYSRLKTPDKTFWKVEGGTHINAYETEGQDYRQKFLNLLEGLK